MPFVPGKLTADYYSCIGVPRDKLSHGRVGVCRVMLVCLSAFVSEREFLTRVPNETERSKSPESLHCLVKRLRGCVSKFGLGQDDLDGGCSFFESLDLV